MWVLPCAGQRPRTTYLDETLPRSLSRASMRKVVAPPSVDFDWSLARVGYRRRLPHLVQANTIYFVTFRLADSVPRVKLDTWNRQLQQWLRANPRPHTHEQAEQYAELSYRTIERWLDRGEGSCLLRDLGARAAVEYCLRFGDGKSYWIGEYAIMPNHVHVLVRPDVNTRLKDVVGAWRTVSTQKINKLVERHGSLWQNDVFDHIVRNQQSLEPIRRYVRENGSRLSAQHYTVGAGSLFQ